MKKVYSWWGRRTAGNGFPSALNASNFALISSAIALWFLEYFLLHVLPEWKWDGNQHFQQNTNCFETDTGSNWAVDHKLTHQVQSRPSPMLGWPWRIWKMRMGSPSWGGWGWGGWRNWCRVGRRSSQGGSWIILGQFSQRKKTLQTHKWRRPTLVWELK